MAVTVYSLHLSPLEGHMPRTYARQIYCFSTTNSQAIETLSEGLAGLAQDVPYVLSRIISDTPGTASSGAVISAPYYRPEDIFSCHDLSGIVDYATLKAGHFAPEVFLTPGIVPPDTIPPYPEPPAIFLARASLVNGGLILCVAVHHLVTDITGYDALLKIWASHCRKEDVGFDRSWMDRSPLYSSSQSLRINNSHPMPMPDLLHTKIKEDAVRGTDLPSTAKGKKDYQTGVFYFPRQHLRALKDATNAHIALQEPGSWVSTSDVLSALLWSVIVRAQDHPYLRNGRVTRQSSRISTLSFPVQFRSVLRPALPRNFLGAAFLMTSARVPHEDVCRVSDFRSLSISLTHDQEPGAESHVNNAGMQEPIDFVDISALANVALAIRRSVHGIDDATVRGVLDYLEAHPRPNPEARLVLGPPRCEPGGSNTSVVSWADQCIYELDWGHAIGRCDAVRLAKMTVERNPIILPHIPGLNGDDGGIEVIMSYEEDIMQRLTESHVMKRLATLRCLS
ncbi:hypothetical protein F5B22DRAFT_645369 [Xylaria bambusicola]|uniref:uncharacterized protein n=1 Tax=Xylaria bambusicola TaxID=326684 RepID=UPI0020083E5E|nr:uncharacterized protein F5B22DRAFT_645369 [Xylaria bambusicola]KAI0518119.1 hypothetical protein F5B22DRAFT_645369 [Xylaria bambusicola]